MKPLFTKQDIGCYADCTNGEQHRRDILSGLLDDIGRSNGFEPSEQLTYISGIRELVMAESSDDYSEETEAIEILQSVTEEGFVWVMEAGDLLLVKASELE